jgi:hypothetical protein
MKRLLIFSLSILGLFTLVACGPEDVDDIDDNTPTDLEVLQDFVDDFDLSFNTSAITEDITLPTTGANGITITWESSNPDVVANDGTIIRSVDGDATVIMTATIALNAEELTKTFTLLVLQSEAGICPNIDDPSEYQIANSGFENGNLCGWTTTGEAFSNDYVLDIETFWTGGSYNKDGMYFFTSNDHEGETGTLTSRTFTLGGTGWISFRLGAAKHTNELYVSIMNTEGTIDQDDDVEVARFGNTAFDDNLFTANMAQYIYDLSTQLGEELYVKIIDEATSDWAWIAMDAFEMYYEATGDLPLDAITATNIMPVEVDCNTVVAPSVNDIINGGFDDGLLCGWTTFGDAFTTDGLVRNSISWGGETSAPEGDFFYSNWSFESTTGSMESSTFVLGGTGYITFRLGAAKNPSLIYVSIKLDNGTEIARYGNDALEAGTEPILNLYKANLSAYLGETLYIEIVDGASEDWGWLVIDSIDTYHETMNDIPAEALQADNIIGPDTTPPVISGVEDLQVLVNEPAPDWLDGVTAIDDEDGEVTVSVDTSEIDLTQTGLYDITYTATDSAGNVASETATVEVTSDDIVKPVIEDAVEEVFILVNGTAPDFLSGVTASDNVDGDLTASLIVDDSELDLTVPGTYEVTISVTDSSSNTTSHIIMAQVVDTLPMIVNGSFETGDLTGWTMTGDAFTLVTDVVQEWFGSYYDIDGTYYFNTWKQGDAGGAGESGTGTLTSSVFELSGTGYVTFMLGAAKNTDNIYVSFYLEDGTEVARFGNHLFNDSPEIYTFQADLRPYLGLNMYVEVVDNQTEDWGILLLDDIEVYYASMDDLPEGATTAVNLIADVTPVVLPNGSFETGDLTGWTTTGDAFTLVTDIIQEWYGSYYDIDGTYYFNTWKQGDAGDAGESGTGTMTSTLFELSGSGYISFMIGGAKVTDNMYLSFLLEDGTEVARFGNSLFSDSPEIHTFTADLSAYLGQTMYIIVVDNQTEDWGIILLDDIQVYYASVDDLPEGATTAVNLLP